MTNGTVVKCTKDLEALQRPESPVVWTHLISFAHCILIKKQKHEIKIKNKIPLHSRDLIVLCEVVFLRSFASASLPGV